MLNDDIHLKIENLHVQFHMEEGVVHAVNGVNLVLNRGRTLAIVGESGSGKSVTAFSILRLIQKPGEIADGKITLYPRKRKPIEITSLNEKSETLYELRGGLVSMIFQEPMTALSPVHTIGNQICEAILLHQNVNKKESEQIAIEMLKKVGIPNADQRLRQYPHEFSGGMRQRVVIAMALVCRPEVLIADEPTTALDVTIQAQFLDLLKSLKEETKTSIIYITHDMGVVAQTADDVAVMYKGRVVEKGTVRQILKDPLHPYTRGLLAAIPSLSGRQERLPTIDSVIGDTDIDTPWDLLTLPDGREIAINPDELTPQLK